MNLFKRCLTTSTNKTLCKRPKYVMGYCKQQSGLSTTIYKDSALSHSEFKRKIKNVTNKTFFLIYRTELLGPFQLIVEIIAS